MAIHQRCGGTSTGGIGSVTRAVDLSVHNGNAERFSYYGMRAILVLYLTNVLLLHPTVDGVFGIRR